MKYKIFLVLIFLSVFGSEKKVVALQFLFYSVINKNLLKTKKTEEQIFEILNETKNEAKKEIKYKIIFDDGSFEENILKGDFAPLINEADTKEILENILNVFDRESNAEVEASPQEIKNEHIDQNKENWKKEYVKKNEETWKNEYQESLKKKDSEEALKKKTWKERLKDSGLFLLGTGLGFVIDRYVLKK
jgi:hypothetical protein